MHDDDSFFEKLCLLALHKDKPIEIIRLFIQEEGRLLYDSELDNVHEAFIAKAYAARDEKFLATVYCTYEGKLLDIELFDFMDNQHALIYKNAQQKVELSINHLDHKYNGADIGDTENDRLVFERDPDCALDRFHTVREHFGYRHMY